MEYSDRDLLYTMRGEAHITGEEPSVRHFDETEELPHPGVYKHIFGSWDNAQKMAGVKTSPSTLDHSPQYLEEDLLYILKGEAHIPEGNPTESYFEQTEELPDPAIYRKHFGSWNSAREEAGLEPLPMFPADPPNPHLMESEEALLKGLKDGAIITKKLGKYSIQDLLHMLKGEAHMTGKSPSERHFREADKLPQPNVYRQRFGSWNVAKEKVGLETFEGPPFREQYSKEEMLYMLRGETQLIGRTPTGAHFKETPGIPGPKAYSHRFGSWNQAKKEAGLTFISRGEQLHSNEDLLHMLRGEAHMTGVNPTEDYFREREDLPHPHTYRRRFGSWGVAKREAGLAAFGRPPKYSSEELLYLLRGEAHMTEGNLTAAHFRETEELPSLKPYQKRFGSWTKAKEEAGLQDPRHSDEELLYLLKGEARVTDGYLPKRHFAEIEDLPNPRTFTRRFGSWNEAKEEAGLEPVEKGYNDRDLLYILQGEACVTEETPTTRHFLETEEIPTPHTYKERFGSWNQAKEEAGLETLPPEKQNTYSDDELLYLLKGEAHLMRKSPTMTHFKETEELPSPTPYKERFGTWNVAKERAGLETHRSRWDKYGREELLKMLKGEAHLTGKTPTVTHFRETDELPSVTPFVEKFGSWNNAKEEAGLETYGKQISA